MNSKTIYYVLYSLFILLVSWGCVTKKKYKQLQANLNQLQTNNNSLNSENSRLTLSNNQLTNENSKMSKKIDELTISIVETSNTTISPEPSIPVIPNPPPSSTDYFEFVNILKHCKTYLDANNILLSAFRKSGTKMVYLAFQGQGFAVATPIDEINTKGEKIREEISGADDVYSFISNLLSKKHLNELLFSKMGYYRWVVFIVSPQVNSLNGNEVDPEIIRNWVNYKQTKFPFEKLQNPMPRDTHVYALLYEFQQNENLRGKLKLLKSRNITNLLTYPIVNILKHKDDEVH